MNARLPALALVATMLFGIGLLWGTGDSLPLQVASHFDTSGTANGYMPRAVYLW